MKQIDKLNEDFFDDFDSNNLIDDTVDDLIYNPDYTYNIQFIIYMFPFIKEYNGLEEPVYSFEDPEYGHEYKATMESGFLSMKKVLDYILNATPIVTDYSKPKFCSSYEKIIEEFPFMNNKPSNKFETLMDDDNFIILETSINLYRRKNEHSLLKMFYSFWKLQKMYDKLVTTIYPNIDITRIQHIHIVFYKNNSYKKSVQYHLMPSSKRNSVLLRFIKFLNDKDETDK